MDVWKKLSWVPKHREAASIQLLGPHVMRPCGVGQKLLWTLIETVCGDQGQFHGCVGGGVGGLVGRKWHRTFLVGGTDKARSGNVLHLAAEYQEVVEMVG